MKPLHIPSSGGRTVNVLGIPMILRLLGRETGGVVSAVESHDVPGGGPPPHIHHREDETFRSWKASMNGRWAEIRLSQGKARPFLRREVCRIPTAISPNAWRLMCIITPAGFEGFFEEIGALTPAQQGELPRVLEIAKKYGLEVLVPPGA